MDVSALGAWFEAETASGGFSGAALAWRDGRPVFEFAGGLAHRGFGIPNTVETRFAVASITKLPTAIACLRLVERGLLRLDRPLDEVLPPEQRPSALTPAVTLHHVLSHTSGLANYHDDDDPTWASFTANWDRIPSYHVRRPADMLPAFADLPARFRPGERYEYNDAGFILAGLAIEAATGRPYHEVVAAEVFEPAGMADTGIEAIDDEPERLATGYMTDAAAPRGWRSNVFSVTAMGMPDGGMITTTRDLARLIDALVGGRLLAPALYAAMTAPQGPPDAEDAYGYGCLLTLEDGRVTTIGHGGSDPGVSAMVVHHLGTATTIVTICNQDRGGWASSREIQRALGLVEAAG